VGRTRGLSLVRVFFEEESMSPAHADVAVPRHSRGALDRLRIPWRSRATTRIAAAAVLDSLDPAVVVQDPNGVIATWNASAERRYGFSAAEAVGRSMKSLVPSASWSWEDKAVKASLLGGLSDAYDTERLPKDGAVKRVSVEMSPIKNSVGAIVGVSTIEWDRRADLGRAVGRPGIESYLPGAFEDAPIGVALVSVEPATAGRIFRVNRALCKLAGYSRQWLEQTDTATLVHPDDAATDLAAMERLNAAELDGFQLEQRLLHYEHHAVWVTINVSLVRDRDGAPLYCIRQMQDIDERKRYESELGHLVEHDPLTGLLNRRGFLRELTHEMAYSRRYGGRGAVLFLDLDNFKWVNDTLGHNAGDEVISEVARVLGERLRETDALARLGGDEFAVLLPQTNSREAQSLSASLVASVRDGCSVSLAGGRAVTLSIGINWFERPADSVTADDVLIDADSAMYAAKDGGKDRFVLASPATHEHPNARVTWAERVRRAVEGGLFELYCQPIVDFASDTVAQWELLLRLPGDGGELILPSQFLYTAERSGLILEIDRWVLGEALKLLVQQRDCGHNVRLAVNISGRSVGSQELLAVIENGLVSSGLDPASLILEVTETAAIANMDRARGFANELQSLGCSFALDDFGAGFGSFYYLKHIPFDYVKIDGEFIRNLAASTTDQLILDSIVQMSNGLGTHTVAEFVGDQATVEVLKAHGVDYGQGYHLGRPIPVAEALPSVW
jgi:diguanylate cyclase (GGDEF)-like protein/PAS domain S-box-containing protein